MDLGLEGRRAVVAAATSGLGLAAAGALVAEGARVAICGRDQARLDAAAASLRRGVRDGDAVVAIRADVSSAEGAADFVGEATSRLGGVDVLVTNGGGPHPGTFESTPVEDYPAALSANLLAVVAMCRTAVPAMRAQRWGRVVAITSIGVRQPIPNLILSNTARAGVTGFLKTLALEVAADGVTVNSLLPGLHATARLTSLYGGGDPSTLAAGIPAAVLGQPDDFGAVVAFLCSQPAGFVTGTSIAVDGGSDRALL